MVRNGLFFRVRFVNIHLTSDRRRFIDFQPKRLSLRSLFIINDQALWRNLHYEIMCNLPARSNRIKMSRAFETSDL